METAHIFQSGVRNRPASMSRREIEVFNPQVWDSRLRRESWQVYIKPVIKFWVTCSLDLHIPITNVLLCGWILSTTGNFPASIKGKSRVFSCNRCCRLWPSKRATYMLCISRTYNEYLQVYCMGYAQSVHQQFMQANLRSGIPFFIAAGRNAWSTITWLLVCRPLIEIN